MRNIPAIMRVATAVLVAGWASSVTLIAVADPPVLVDGTKFAAEDSLKNPTDESADAAACLKGLTWPAAKFTVTATAVVKGRGDYLVRFPSPIDSGDKVNDSVAMLWYVAKDNTGAPIAAPAIVVVHESGSDMVVGKMFAGSLRALGVHAFLLQLPQYGHRRSDADKQDAADFLLRMRQGVADVRRARDAVAVLPKVDASHIALQGTSLGGFVAANAASLDGAGDTGFDTVFITLAGGNLFDMITHGKKDAAKVREKLAAAGLQGDKLKAVLNQVEPTRIAHRLPPERTWLYSASADTVVPWENAVALAKAANLPQGHHVRLAANHYSGLIYLPRILAHMRRQLPGTSPLDDE